LQRSLNKGGISLFITEVIQRALIVVVTFLIGVPGRSIPNGNSLCIFARKLQCKSAQIRAFSSNQTHTTSIVNAEREDSIPSGSVSEALKQKAEIHQTTTPTDRITSGVSVKHSKTWTIERSQG
jgi:hypothetical protein